MPAYRVDVTGSAERDLSRLSHTLFERLTTKLAALAADPRPNGREKLAGLEAYRIRVGDYRVLYEIDDAKRMVVVVRVRHRRDVYKKR